MSNKTHKENWNLIKNYSWRSIFFKYLRTILIAFSLPIAILIAVIFFVSSYTEKAHTETALEKSFGKTLSSVEQSIRESDINAAALSSDKSILSLLSLKISPETQELTAEYYKVFDIKSQVAGITKDYISSISLYSMLNQYIYAPDSSYYSDYKYKDIIDYSLSGNASPKLFYSSSKKSLVRTYPVFKPNSNDRIGVIYTYFDILSFNNTILGGRKNDEQIFILNTDKEFIFTGDVNNSIASEDEEIINMLAQDADGEYTLKTFGDYYYCASVIPTYNYILVSKIPASYISSGKQITFTMIIIIAVTVILTLFLAFFVSIRMYGTIAEIIAGIEVPALQSLSDQEKQFNELLYINNNILSIMDKNAIIEKELEERINQLRRAQSVALQTQINPHFIFNTLNLVNVFIMKITKKDTDATRIISLLSDILHDMLNTNNFIVTLREELKFAYKYIEIEKIKSLDSFDVKLDIAPETLNCRIIKLSLQPIIENSVEHGFKNLSADRRGLLTIRSEIINKTLVVTITDNGEGMPLKTLKELSERLSSDIFPETKHIGLCNVSQRIRLIFGSEYGVTVQSSPAGTSVVITLPANSM